MKKYLLSIITTIIIGTPSLVWAGDNYENAPNIVKGVAVKSGIGNIDNLFGFLGNGLVVVYSMVGIIFFILMLYAGFRWFSSRGEADAVTAARSTLIASVIGLFIIMMAYTTSTFLFNSLLEKNQASPDGDKPPVDGDAVLGCCVDLYQNTYDLKQYTGYITSVLTCERRQGVQDGTDTASGPRGEFWDFFVAAGNEQLKCNRIIEYCYQPSEPSGFTRSSCANKVIENNFNNPY